MPKAPPAIHCMTVSTMNCRRMSRFVAPTARRTPISLRRRFTLTSITFMMTIPPMITDMALTRMNTPKNAELILRLFKIPRVRLDVDSQTCVCTLHAQEYRQGNHDEVVLILPKDAADLLYDPYHHEFVIPDAKALPDRIHAKKQLLHQGVADQADVSPMLGFRCREVAAKLYSARVNIRHAWRLPIEIHVRYLFVAVSRVHAAAGRGANLLAGGAAFGDGAHVLELNLLVLERLDDDVEVRHRKRCACDLKHVCGEVGDLLFDVNVGALDD